MTQTPTPRIQLLLVDDHHLFRRGLRALLSQDERFEVVCEAGDIGEALRCLAQAPRPDVILLDNHLPGVRGVDAIPTLKDAAPGTRILMLTVSENEDDLAAALRAGADGYLLKTVESDQLAETIVKVLDGESVISPEMLTKLVSVFRARPAETTPAPLEPPNGPSPALLSPREREILLLIARGDSNKLIARALDIAETTVKIHVQHILRKLGLSSRVQAAVFATSHGLV
ncbi:response regulator [Hydrogenophaga sp. A37]|uniref:response regulator n=1 Tax=Hydrogenophaga sp. A37 TaxID=1945864 RepID=UPI00098479C4|nr:response regulator transcription factor [Hydrogenophaga sp. A37]OOG87025.1 DNA-binding response regulator [Hydrogenophaga sp. A37]